MKKKKEPDKPANHERWLVSYADFMTLLMIFFVVMYAMSNIDSTKYKQMSDSLRVAMGGGKTVVGTNEAANIQEAKPEVKPAEETEEQKEEKKLEQVKKEVDGYINTNQLTGSVVTSIEERGLVISFEDNIFFDSGKADIKDGVRTKLDSVATILKKIDNYVRVEGHTDNLPINTAMFQSNYQLSAMRAANVVEYLVVKDGMNGAKLSSVGYGEHRPVASNDTEANRSKNRRVDVVILNSNLSASESVSK
ncbi:chemotaxis protein MotB [Clostridium cavendishii DSM 21758]|uniref:Chemotaxis protein MotB n=1 Tax=Clostridium cavendishii DSM 21758 TaxID=1121302 RepID=A0A1M6VZH9_9CLOT|nr:flagellar motor protein MotB [Clostridium cavendishii]SHK86857.1 chemotaxis protein MotB [Clostridium cavendishii DSM 21758]